MATGNGAVESEDAISSLTDDEQPLSILELKRARYAINPDSSLHIKMMVHIWTVV
jgi:hypothetical protein